MGKPTEVSLAVVSEQGFSIRSISDALLISAYFKYY